MPDLSQPPPSRYRVVERDRRLVVIETASGRPVQPDATPSLLPRRTKFDGSATLTTMAFYDDKAPRTIRLGPDSASAIGWLKVASGVVLGALLLSAFINIWLLLPFALFIGNDKLRKMMRRGITRALDRLEVANPY